MRHHSSIGIVTRPCGWTTVVRFPHEQHISSSRKLPDRFWVPPNFLYSGYWLTITSFQSGRDVQLTTYLVARLRMSGATPLSP